MVILKLKDGSLSSVPLERLSGPDQDFVRKMENSGAAATAPTTVSGQLTWPSAITVSPRSMIVTEGVQDAAGRAHHYETGNFHFVSNAPLAALVMRDVAADFELMRAFLSQVQWGWEPRPANGKNFKVFFTETQEDFFGLGGVDNSFGGIKGDYIFFKFQTLGLEKLGGRYTYNPRNRSEGDVVGLTLRLLLGEMRYLLYPWANIGLEEVLGKLAYRKDGIRFADLNSPLKKTVEDYAALGVFPDSERMLVMLRTYKLDGSGVLLHRRQRYFDSLLLCYYFGFLEGDGKGTSLHGYFQGIAKEATAYRTSILSAGKVPRPRTSGTWDAWALEHMDKLLAGRDDAQLKAEMLGAYATIGVKFPK